MSVGKPKIPEVKPPAASPPAANMETAALETGADESDVQSQIDKQRKGRSSLRIEEGRAGRSAEKSTLNTASSFTIGNIAAMAPAAAPTAPKPAAAAPTPSYTNDKTTGGTSPVMNAQNAAANHGSKPGGGNINDAMSGGTNNKNSVSTRPTPSPKPNTSYSANDKKGNPKSGGSASKGRDKSR